MVDEQTTWAEMVFYLVLIVWWIFGIAAVKGFWMTLIAFCFPPVAWVVLAELVLERL